jgi:hypothetical protein
MDSSPTPRAFVAQIATPKGVLLIGLILIVAVLINSGLRTLQKDALEFCGDLRSQWNIEGAYAGESPSTFPEIRRSAFPLGAECSYFAGDDSARIVVFDDFGTVPLLSGLVLVATAPILALARHRRTARPGE